MSLELFYISGVPTGIFTGILLPYILDFFASTITKKMLRLIKILNLKTNGNSFLDNIKLPGNFFRQLLSELDIPINLKEAGIPKSKLSSCSKNVLNLITSNSLFYTPKKVTKGDILDIYGKAYE